ncbi:MAG TPA: ArsA family ATPase [Myxococcota bacterium]|jgi:arsenite-transporting ATPase
MRRNNKRDAPGTSTGGGARLVLFSGKGGVGKTTVAAATAVGAARAGQRTLVASLDRAHNLAAVLGVAPSSSPQPVPGCPGLACIEIDPQAELASQWQLVRSTVGRLLAWLGASVADADAMAVFPGIEELIVLARLASLAESADHDVIIVDLAPTASSLRYLSFPDLMAGLFGKLAHLERTFARVLRPLVNKQKVPLPEDGFYAALDDVAAVLARLRDRLVDPARCVARLVAIPERIVVDETAAAMSALSLFGITVDTVIMNRVLPDAMSAGPWSAWRAVQERELERARTMLPGLVWRELPFQPGEPLGVDALAAAGRSLYDDSDPSLPARTAPALSFSARGDDGSGELRLALAGVRPGDVDVASSADGVVITVGAWRRTVALPAHLAHTTPTRAVVAADGALHITLAPREPARRSSS